MQENLLRQRYLASFPAKAAALREALADLRAAPDQSRRMQLRGLTHKFSGSAGLYGFEELGEAARAVVHAIDSLHPLPEILSLGEGVLAQLESLGPTKDD